MRFTIIALALLVAFTATTALGEEFPYVPGTEIAPGSGPVLQDQIQPQPLLTRDPVWKGLERLTQQERLNSDIELVLEKNASQEALQMARRIESTWNSGNFKEALALFGSLGDLTNIDEVAIGNSWRTPIPTEQTTTWGTDVRIGNRDEIFVTALDIHRASGNLFAILLYQEGTTYYWSVNLSTNGGATWTETYTWWATYALTTLSASVVTSHCYVGFARGSSQDQAFLYQFRVTDGQQENFPSGPSYITVFTTTLPDYIKEVVLTSNQDSYDNRLYYSAIISDGELKFYYGASPDYEVWYQIATNVTNADRGLDATWNEGYALYFLWFSYFNTDDQVQIDGLAASWTNLTTYSAGTSTDYTAIGAYRDTVTSFFDYHGSRLYCRYLVSYNGGTNWYWGIVDDTTVTAESPDVAARKGGGVGVVQRFYAPSREGHYAWRPYSGTWSAPETYTDHEPYYNKPCIEQLGGGKFGVVYLTWNTPQVRAAYFDRQSLLPDVSIELVPDHSPVVVPRGGSFGFTGTVTNNTNLAQRVDIWLMAYVPGIGMYGPLKRFNNVPFNAYQSRRAHLNQNIPNIAPISDRYIYYGYVGDYPSTVIDSSYFRFEVTAKALAKAGASDWTLTGSFFEGDLTDLPSEYALLNNYPNPFNAETNISFSLAEAGNVSLKVYDITGRLVVTLVDGQMDAGEHLVAWDASSVSSGVYFYKLAAGAYTATKSMNLLK